MTLPTALSAPGSRWHRLQARFDRCAPRERALLIGAATALALMLCDALWLGPALARFQAARSQQATAAAAQQGLLAELHKLSRQGSSQVHQQQAELALWRQRVREADAGLRSHEDSLVGPDRMVGLLEQLLARHGEVKVRTLRSLGRSDVLATLPGNPAATNPANGANPGMANAGPADSKPGTPGSHDAPPAPPTLYRHGVELALEGGFADLLAYLRAVEALPQRVLWGGVSLKVEQHPKSVLTLRVYTLSRDRHWLEI